MITSGQDKYAFAMFALTVGLRGGMIVFHAAAAQGTKEGRTRESRWRLQHCARACKLGRRQAISHVALRNSFSDTDDSLL